MIQSRPSTSARTFTLEVWGDYGCFTRPELKVERFSYPIITPSAARAIYDAIYLEFDKRTGRPAHRWEVSRVEVLSPVRYVALMRNEVKEKISTASVKKWMQNPALTTPIYADATKEDAGTDTKGRTQRQTMALKAPRYRLHAHTVLFDENFELRQKIERSFERRGQCIYQPYLGCREFTAAFELVDRQQPGLLPPQLHDEEIGWMLYDVFDLSRPGGNSDDAAVSLFEASIRAGVLEVPPYASDAVRKPGVAGCSAH
ncbi:type I-C CRISPR-associated protein Cas5 (plasmid) [Deinococcus metallilatus]|uniref:CRISPR-associated protein Cas5d n=1 Tax=Deinococcus metallilatus TaxID=1211322 RepID=A0AAJ5JZP6_9DEIO|nr:type I-C CRISPR-associated protein Cas5c [Deinococcus metallilatus]MBB5293200.1 CRISPR-associated protein Cas5d [Deinococcus metallilatus]QBY06992.1 type I-C CRISPR-associated protein Cas5 [Deinococcus metallilatus]RXJ18003.1 type I-C CRISPR-associated protein Cas5 [Deinococcus metallilatus]TLK31939.1 type I-C CRISPR-associated protein Cas5 [Deinococcus metallilatus]GMA15576.1 type I-C CRISPR-associated protein Cas5 [Deinococcus metallilatus]